MAESYQSNPLPGFTSPTFTFKDEELLYSEVGYTQNGVVLAGGQGVLKAGTLLGRKSSDQKYYVYNNGASDGTEVCRGVLRRSIDLGGTNAPDQWGNIVIAGILKYDMISGAGANAITDALVDLNGVADTVRGTFKF